MPLLVTGSVLTTTGLNTYSCDELRTGRKYVTASLLSVSLLVPASASPTAAVSDGDRVRERDEGDLGCAGGVITFILLHHEQRVDS